MDNFLNLLKSKKTIVIPAVALLAAIILFSICIRSCSSNGKTVIGFYGISESQIISFKTAIDGIKNEKGKSVYKPEYVALDENLTLEENLKKNSKISLLISKDGLAVKKIASKLKKKNALPLQIVSSMPQSLRMSAASNRQNVVCKLPVLMDHLEIAIDRRAMEDTGTKVISSWRHVENFALKAKEIISAPIAFSGLNELFVLDLISAFTESLDGADNYEKAVKMISETIASAEKSKKAPNYIRLAENLVEKKGAPCIGAINFLNKLYREDLFGRSVFTFDNEAVSTYMKTNQTAAVFQMLSDHRSKPHESVAHYSSIYFPSNYAAADRSFIAPIICAVPLSKSKIAKEICAVLVAPEIQENLARSTGLAPVVAECGTPDRESDDVRYWVSATNAPHNGFSQDAFESKTHAVELSKMLMNYIVK